MSINQVCFTTIPENPQVYKLKIGFLDETGTEISSCINPLVFRQERLAPQRVAVDFFTKNATSKTRKNGSVNLNQLFSQVFGRSKRFDLEELSLAKTILSQPSITTLDAQRVIVLDLNDSRAKYANIEQINACQNAIIENYLKADTVAEKFLETHSLIKELSPRFVIGEGPLKFKVLREPGIFTDEQEEFLTSREGRPYHCQLAEFVMNGFKFGQTTQIEGRSDILFEANEYIHHIGNAQEASFQASQKSIVLFPPFYWDMYSGETDAAFVKAIKAINDVFHISLKGDPSTKITTMTIDKTGE